MKKNNVSVLLLLAAAFTIGLAGIVLAATTVGLGTADNFAILAGSTITNTGSSVINGDLGLSPGTSVTGFPPGTVNGTQHITDAAAAQAQLDLTTAYNAAAGQTATTVPTELGGTTKNAGVYSSAAGTFGITGTLTLDAEGDPNAVFIFKTDSTLITADNSNIVLANSAQACNVFWQVGSSATLGIDSTFKGNILALTDATLTTGANVEGRVLARNGAVTLDTNTITKATCLAPPRSSVSPLQEPAPLIDFTKVPNPLALPLGPGSVTYTYTATNIGKTAVYAVQVEDNTCSPVKFISGDTNNDSILNIDETWIYQCTQTVSQTLTNTASINAYSNYWSGYDTANATVVVGIPLPPPLIHLVKKPNVFLLPAGGGPVTYTYTVTNPGTAPLSDVSVIDDKCTGLPGRVLNHPGDLNKNNLLESNEIWTFTCQTNIWQTTTNIGTAEGHANGLTALDFAPATVVVSSPKLPNTGTSSEESNTWGGIMMLAGIFMLVSTSLVVILRKRAN